MGYRETMPKEWVNNWIRIWFDSVGRDSLFYVKRGGSNQSKESVELELQRGFVAWRNEGRLGAQRGKYFLKLHSLTYVLFQFP